MGLTLTLFTLHPAHAVLNSIQIQNEISYWLSKKLNKNNGLTERNIYFKLNLT